MGVFLALGNEKTLWEQGNEFQLHSDLKALAFIQVVEAISFSFDKPC